MQNQRWYLHEYCCLLGATAVIVSQHNAGTVQVRLLGQAQVCSMMTIISENMKQQKIKGAEPGKQEHQGSKLLGNLPPCQPAAGGGHRLGVEGGESDCLIWTPSTSRQGLAAGPEEQTLPTAMTCKAYIQLSGA